MIDTGRVTCLCENDLQFRCSLFDYPKLLVIRLSLRIFLQCMLVDGMLSKLWKR